MTRESRTVISDTPSPAPKFGDVVEYVDVYWNEVGGHLIDRSRCLVVTRSWAQDGGTHVAGYTTTGAFHADTEPAYTIDYEGDRVVCTGWRWPGPDDVRERAGHLAAVWCALRSPSERMVEAAAG